jgi:hypothetical protein
MGPGGRAASEMSSSSSLLLATGNYTAHDRSVRWETQVPQGAKGQHMIYQGSPQAKAS